MSVDALKLSLTDETRREMLSSIRGVNANKQNIALIYMGRGDCTATNGPKRNRKLPVSAANMQEICGGNLAGWRLSRRGPVAV